MMPFLSPTRISLWPPPPRYHPILMFICARFPKTFCQEDEKGRTPIYVACSGGCSPEFICHLVTTFPQSVATKDNKKRTPIHHLCSLYASKACCQWKRTFVRT
jgi:hypothetical protein